MQAEEQNKLTNSIIIIPSSVRPVSGHCFPPCHDSGPSLPVLSPMPLVQSWTLAPFSPVLLSLSTDESLSARCSLPLRLDLCLINSPLLVSLPSSFRPDLHDFEPSLEVCPCEGVIVFVFVQAADSRDHGDSIGVIRGEWTFLTLSPHFRGNFPGFVVEFLLLALFHVCVRHQTFGQLSELLFNLRFDLWSIGQNIVEMLIWLVGR